MNNANYTNDHELYIREIRIIRPDSYRGPRAVRIHLKIYYI